MTHQSMPVNPIPQPTLRRRRRWRYRVHDKVFDLRVRLANWLRPW